MAMFRDLPEFSLHFSRFRVLEISTDEHAVQQFALEPMLQAAMMLADAEVDWIVYAATSGAWLGVDHDLALCAAVKERTGIPTTTTILDLIEVFDAFKIQDYGLVCGYTNELVERIKRNFEMLGYRCCAWQNSGITTNKFLSQLSSEVIANMVREVSQKNPEMIVILGTNVWGAQLAAELELELQHRIIDSISASLWRILRHFEINTAKLHQWGSLFKYL